MNKHDFEQDLRLQLDTLEKDKLPQRDLWSGIELALVENLPKRASGVAFARIRLLAASLLLVGVIGWLSFTQSSRSINGIDLVTNLSEQHLLQKQALLVQFKDQPALTQNWQEQLVVLDEAEVAIKAALKSDPNNMALLKLLQNVYQQQMSLIERVHTPKWSQI
jgi:hypothetical protein